MHTASSFDSAWKSFNNALNYAYYIKCGGDTNQFDPHGDPKQISIKCHQLRHTYAILLYLSKTDMFLASKLMGHASVQITLDIYTDLDNKYQALSRLSELLKKRPLTGLFISVSGLYHFIIAYPEETGDGSLSPAACGNKVCDGFVTIIVLKLIRKDD